MVQKSPPTYFLPPSAVEWVETARSAFSQLDGSEIKMTIVSAQIGKWKSWPTAIKVVPTNR